MADIPTADEAFADAAPTTLENSPYPAALKVRKPEELPTAEDAFGAVQEGWAQQADKAIQQSTFRIFNAFGYSGAEAFGKEPAYSPATSLSPETEKFMRNMGVFNDYSKGQADFFRDMYEGVIKNSAATLALTQRAGAAAIAAPLGSLGQFLEEVGILPAGHGAELAGAATDPGAMVLFGPGGVRFMEESANARRAANLHVDIPAARSNGVLAEGEAGHFEAVPVTTEHAQARVEAAREAGLPTPAPVEAAPDIHTLARRIDPPAFEKFDALEAEKNAHRQTITDLAVERENLPEAIQARDEINTILGKVHGVEERLTKKAAERLSDAQSRLNAILSQDTPGMASERAALLQADIAQRDLVPQVSSAYRQARDMMPEKAADVAKAVEDVSAGKPVEATKRPVETAAQSPEIATGEFQFQHATQEPLTGTLPKFSAEAPSETARYDAGTGGTFGSKGVYLDNSGAFTTPGKMERFSFKSVYDVKVNFKKAFRLTPETASKLQKIIPQKSGLSSGEDVAAALQRDGYDGIIVEGFDKLDPDAAAEIMNKSGLGAEIAQDQVFAFNPTAVQFIKPSEGGASSKTRTTTNLRPVVGTGPLETRTLAEGVEAKAIEEQLTDNFGDLPDYHQVSMADQAAKATEYLATSPDDAKAVAMGQKAPPRGVLPESVFVAVEKQAIADGDVETLRALATESKLTTAATTMGQRIRTLGERDKTSPVAAIQEVQAARASALEAKDAAAVKNTVKEIKATVKREAPPRDAWKSFIESITCPE